MSAEFDIAAVEREIAGRQFSGKVQHFASVGSTNQLALEAAVAGAREGVWVADEQTAGRGRGGHQWHSAAEDGLYVSVLVTPSILLSHASRIPLATGLAVQAAIFATTGMMPDLRWPNDLVFGVRKCGGILVESISEGGGEDAKLRYAVIGVGVNVNHKAFPEELRGLATSLYLEAEHSFAREPLLGAFLRYLDCELAMLGNADLFTRFAASSTWVSGKQVRVEEGGGYTGITRGLDAQGFLRVENNRGEMQTVLSGGVRSV